MINARSETADAKPAFRDALRFRRCLIPADVFYEWQKSGSAKQPLLKWAMSFRCSLVRRGLFRNWGMMSTLSRSFPAVSVR
jgi:putative SOS response-associated peptidase YedK